MSVWSFEAADIADSAELESRPIYYTPDIQEFLGGKSSRRIIGGLKGTGKTLFLKLISHHYRRLPGFACIPTNQLTERLYSIDYDFSGERARAWSSSERWKHVWRTVLSVVVLKAVGQHGPQVLQDHFPESLGLSVGAHLSAAIQSRAVNDPQFQNLFSERLDAAIQGIREPVGLFLDNIDEALARHSGYDLYRDSVEPQTQLGAHSYELWLAAQLGFVLATRELSARNEHLKLFGTIRTEVLRDNRTPTAFNTQSFVLDLRYAPTDLRGIFSTKLEQLLKTFRHSFPRPTISDPIKAFFLDDTIEHPSVTGADGRPLAEDIFEYLRRHTRGRPRELDFIGHRLQMIPPLLRTPQAIRECVRDLSCQFFEYARNEAVPFWDPRVDELLEKVPSNFVSQRQASTIASKLGGPANAHALWETAYANGLCGAVVPVHPGEAVQRFSKHDSGADLSLADFRSARTWVLHPCVNIATRPRRARYRPYLWSVAGHAYPFSPAPRSPRKHLHVLVGAGKLGFGLVVPMLLADGGTRVLVVARASDAWRPLLAAGGKKSRVLRVQYFAKAGQNPSDYSVTLGVLTDEAVAWQTELSRALRQSRCVVLVASVAASLRWAVGLADSIGVSVGTKELESVARTIALAAPTNALVLAYENDEDTMLVAQQLLAQRSVAFVPTVVDRICVERQIHQDGVSIRAESYGSITALVPSALHLSLPPAFLLKAHKDLCAVSDAEEFAFVREKKRRLVNAMQAAGAALVHCALMDAGARPETADDVVFGLLTKTMEIDVQLVGVKELLILSVLGALPAHRLAGAELPALIQELDDYSDLARKRMEVPDVPSRVLRVDVGSLAKKYERLFSDVHDLALQALRHAAIREAFAVDDREIVARLAALKDAFLTLFARAGGHEGQR